MEGLKIGSGLCSELERLSDYDVGLSILDLKIDLLSMVCLRMFCLGSFYASSFCIQASKLERLKLSVCLSAEYSLDIFFMLSRLGGVRVFFCKNFGASLCFTNG